MIDQNFVTNSSSFLTRVSQHDAAKKGAAALIAGVLVAVVSEALWHQEQ